MGIRVRKTKKGLVYDARYHIDGEGSKKVSKAFSRKCDARDFLIQKEKELRDRRLGVFKTLSFEETSFRVEAEKWLNHGKVHFSPSHYSRVRDILEKDLLPKYKNWEINRFNHDMVTILQSERKKINRRIAGQQASNATVNRVTEVLSAILNHSAKSKRIPFNPILGYSKLPDDAKEMTFWEPDEARDFLAYLDSRFPGDHLDRWFFVSCLTFLNTAVRAGEMWGLQPIDLAKKRPLIHIKRQWMASTNSFEMLKGKRNRKDKQSLPYRHVARNDQLNFELEETIKRRKVKPTQTIFFGLDGKPRNSDSFRQRFKRELDKWGGRPIRVHDLRHTAITLWVHHGVNLKVVQQMAGHENISTTMKYVHMVAGSVEDVSGKFFVGVG